ncbi:MAG: diguanylate cyclase [Candidatus Thiodiazotropha endolucinida]|uniref:diguanylate cyclase n=1 Tax=Candidatus Thiodiazotropha taylori TaxID=2792791 RepID=A0A9E4NI49_9GAMM|nr:diguanylate cyclase [Candidatus Thiodiazotropha taylori]MCW4235516.1 diguanylate cyclase [Candidatus Thiodiazotropha endolucinida]
MVLMLLAGILVVMAISFQWKISSDAAYASELDTQYQQAMDDYNENNIYYSPQATTQWIVQRQNPAGYFVTNPDMLFEPSQLNNSTLRGTRYAISTLGDLNGLHTINRHAVIDFILGLYETEIKQTRVETYTRYQRGTRYDGFKTLPGQDVGVRPTMDALMILNRLDLLDDPRLNLDGIWNFIVAHQNEDGGFWDEHYPKLLKDSSMKCTSFAARALAILSQHTGRPIPEKLSKGVIRFVQNNHDIVTGGYSSQPGENSDDSYNAFRAFKSIWDTTNGSDEIKHQAVSDSIDMNALIDYFNYNHYLVELGGYSRHSNLENKKASIKATHLTVWLLHNMQLLDYVDKQSISKYVMSMKTPDGQYGGDIYTTYSAIGLLQKMGIPSAPKPEPEKPEKPAIIPSIVPTTFFITALITLHLGYQTKKFEFKTINKALIIQASTDALTGIYNRQCFEQKLKHEIEKSLRYKRPLTTIMFDIDNFKRINDKHGHIAGDTVLKEISVLIKDALRDSDIFARWGGEEFIILSTETDIDGGRQLAKKMLDLINEKEFTVVQKISASFGVTEFGAEDSMESLVKRVDNAMLEAKRQGKNRIISVDAKLNCQPACLTSGL